MNALAEKIAEPNREPALDPIDLTEWIEADPPPRRWAVDGMIATGAVTSLYGHGGAGKTLLALNAMIVSAASATRDDQLWLGRKVAPGVSVALLAEDDAHECVRRVKRICRARGLNVADVAAGVQIVSLIGEDATLAGFFPGGAEIYFTPLWHRLEATLKDQFASLLILDFAAAVYGGDELRRDQVAAFMRALNGLAQRHDIAVLLLGHPSAEGMRNGRGHSGSTGWHNHTRAFLHLEVLDEVADDERSRLTLTIRKNNYGRSGDVLKLAFDGTLFEVLEEDRATRAARGPKLSAKQRVCLSALKKAVDEAGEPSPGGPIPNSVRCVRTDLWRRYAYAAGVSDSENEDSRRRAFYDTRIPLQSKGLVGVSEPYAWLA
ncbi:MAG: AAA family ATPase [Caulobacterales bacterium]